MKLPLFFSIFSFVLLVSCGQPPPENPYPVDKRFQTSAPNKLLFNNLRSTQYAQQEDPENRIYRYFHKKWFSGREQDGLGLVIVDNWLFDQVYLEVVRLHAPNEPIGLPLLVESLAVEQELTFSLTDHQWLDQLQFCRSWESALRQSDSLHFQAAGGKQLPVFPLPKDQQYFRQVLADFDELTR